jgi:hypothetical protein
MSLIHVDRELKIYKTEKKCGSSVLIDSDNAPLKTFGDISVADYYILYDKKDVMIMENGLFHHKMFESMIRVQKPVLIISKKNIKELMKKI